MQAPSYPESGPFGRLRLTGETVRDTHSTVVYTLRCDCGSDKVVTARMRDLRRGRVLSCGCLGIERRRAAAKAVNAALRAKKQAGSRRDTMAVLVPDHWPGLAEAFPVAWPPAATTEAAA